MFLDYFFGTIATIIHDHADEAFAKTGNAIGCHGEMAAMARLAATVRRSPWCSAAMGQWLRQRQEQRGRQAGQPRRLTGVSGVTERDAAASYNADGADVSSEWVKAALQRKITINQDIFSKESFPAALDTQGTKKILAPASAKMCLNVFTSSPRLRQRGGCGPGK